MSRSKVKVTTDKNGVFADISGITELICAKFTHKTCLVPRSDEFEGQGQFRRPACCVCLEKNIFALIKGNFLWFAYAKGVHLASVVQHAGREQWRAQDFILGGINLTNFRRLQPISKKKCHYVGTAHPYNKPRCCTFTTTH